MEWFCFYELSFNGSLVVNYFYFDFYLMGIFDNLKVIFYLVIENFLKC